MMIETTEPVQMQIQKLGSRLDWIETKTNYLVVNRSRLEWLEMKTNLLVAVVGALFLLIVKVIVLE